MTQALHTDPIVLMAMTDDQLGVDPTAYTYHLFKWQGSAKDYADDGRRRDNSSGLPPQLLIEALNRKTLRAGTTDDINDAIAWMRERRQEVAGRLVNPMPPEVWAADLAWAATVNRHTLRYGKPVTKTLDLAGAQRLWLCVVPRRKYPEHGDGR